jgi:hypothetical protein
MKENVKYVFFLMGMAMFLTGISFVSGVSDTGSSDSVIFETVEIEEPSLRFAEMLYEYDTVISNPDAFLRDAEGGRVQITLPGKEFDLELQETDTVSDNARVFTENETGIYTEKAAAINTYRGKVVGDDNSSVGLAVSDQAIIGHVEAGNEYYAIELTNKTHDGKVVLVVYDSKMIRKSGNAKPAL